MRKTIDKAREKLNDTAFRVGNKMLRIPRTQTGLGNLLTTDINFRRVGATAGIVAPAVGLWANDVYNLGADPIAATVFTPLMYACTFAFSVPASAILGLIGYEAGEVADRIVGDKDTPRSALHIGMLRDKAATLNERADRYEQSRREGYKQKLRVINEEEAA